jgi:AhpD family alkylhydroperoxidase
MFMSRIQAPKQQPLFGSLVNTYLRRRYGKAFPALQLLGHHANYPFAYAVFSSIFSMGKTKLSPEIKRLVTQLVAEINGCAFCIDLGQRLAQEEKLNLQKLQRVLMFETDTGFSPIERAALRYAQETTQVGARVSDETFAELKMYFSDKEILELTVAVATENFYNRLNAPLEIESQGFCAVAFTPEQVHIKH